MEFQIPTEVIATYEGVRKHLEPAAGDSVLLVLKGHLLVEETLRAFLRNNVRNPEVLVDARLQFHQVLHLVRAIGDLEHLKWAFDGAQLLNRIRNDFAHQLEPAKGDSRIQAFLRHMSLVVNAAEASLNPGYKRMGPLGYSIVALCMYLSSGLHVEPDSLYEALRER